MREHPLATKQGIELFVAALFHVGAMCPKCSYGTRVTSKRWAKCKKMRRARGAQGASEMTCSANSYSLSDLARKLDEAKNWLEVEEVADELRKHPGPSQPVGWIATHEDGGRTVHFSRAKGWKVEAVAFESESPATSSST